jgi:hypothetical protein
VSRIVLTSTPTTRVLLESEIAVRKAVAAARSVKGVRKVDSTGLKSKD